jgi:hypothetical protein
MIVQNSYADYADKKGLRRKNIIFELIRVIRLFREIHVQIAESRPGNVHDPERKPVTRA